MPVTPVCRLAEPERGNMQTLSARHVQLPNGFSLGHPLGPNSDDTLVRLVYRPQWRIALEFQRERHGGNITDGDSEK